MARVGGRTEKTLATNVQMEEGREREGKEGREAEGKTHRRYTSLRRSAGGVLDGYCGKEDTELKHVSRVRWNKQLCL
jgi:hypothetical protein